MTNPFEEELKKANAVLREGGTILYPTDTIWGIGCDATNTNAIEKIVTLKNRDANKSLIVLVDDEARLQRYVKEVPSNAWDLIEFSDRPLTIIYPKGVNLPPTVTAADGSVAIRIVKNDFCKQLIRKLNKPLISTSANISNEPAPASFNDISETVLHGVDYVVNLHQKEKNHSLPSVILRLELDGKIKFIRK